MVNRVQKDVVKVIAGKKKLRKEKRQRIDHAFNVAKERKKRLVRAGAPRPMEVNGHSTSDEERADGDAGPGGRGRGGGGRGQGPDREEDSMLIELFRSLKWIAVGVETSYNHGSLIATGAGADLVANATEDTPTKSQLINPARAQFT